MDVVRSQGRFIYFVSSRGIFSLGEIQTVPRRKTRGVVSQDTFENLMGSYMVRATPEYSASSFQNPDSNPPSCGVSSIPTEVSSGVKAFRPN